ncbi:MAG: hypothetical protein LBQ60_12520 [Bacteroidales bacterium]|jgi:biopolymer transport protein ExbD|nr:hypothetical protein [Bacteroidales bacterium]
MIEKGTFKQYFNLDTLEKIPWYRFIPGIISALFTSFCYYAFFYMIREALRFVVLFPEDDILVLSDHEVLFYNFIFALIGSVFGLSSFLQFCFPQNKIWRESSKNYYRKMSIFNDLTALNSIFLYWLSQMTFVLSFILGTTAAFCSFLLYPTFNIVWIFVVIVLFMELWKTIRRVAFYKSRYWIFFSAIFILIWSLLLSRIQLLDYPSLNNLSFTQKYHMEYPESGYYTIINNRSLVLDIVIYIDKEGKDTIPTFFVNRTESNLENLQGLVAAYKENNHHETDHKLLTCLIRADKNTRVKDIIVVENLLTGIGLLKVGYRILPTNPDCSDQYYPYVLLKMNPSPSFPEPDENDYSIFPIVIDKNGIIANGKTTDWQQMPFAIQEFILANPDYLFTFELNNNCSYEDNVRIYSTLFSTINHLRNNVSQERYGISFEDLSYEQRDEIRSLFPARILRK